MRYGNYGSTQRFYAVVGEAMADRDAQQERENEALQQFMDEHYDEEKAIDAALAELEALQMADAAAKRGAK